MIKIKLIQENPIVGDISGNLAKAKEQIVIAKKNNVNLIVIKYNEWDGFPKSFLNIIQNKFGLSKTERSNFWRRFKKDDLYPEVMLELKKKR